jgi:hypothetical protein
MNIELAKGEQALGRLRRDTLAFAQVSLPATTPFA